MNRAAVCSSHGSGAEHLVFLQMIDVEGHLSKEADLTSVRHGCRARNDFGYQPCALPQLDNLPVDKLMRALDSVGVACARDYRGGSGNVPSLIEFE